MTEEMTFRNESPAADWFVGVVLAVTFGGAVWLALQWWVVPGLSLPVWAMTMVGALFGAAVAAARVLFRRPAVVPLDEPTERLTPSRSAPPPLVPGVTPAVPVSLFDALPAAPRDAGYRPSLDSMIIALSDYDPQEAPLEGRVAKRPPARGVSLAAPTSVPSPALAVAPDRPLAQVASIAPFAGALGGGVGSMRVEGAERMDLVSLGEAFDSDRDVVGVFTPSHAETPSTPPPSTAVGPVASVALLGDLFGAEEAAAAAPAARAPVTPVPRRQEPTPAGLGVTGRVSSIRPMRRMDKLDNAGGVISVREQPDAESRVVAGRVTLGQAPINDPVRPIEFRAGQIPTPRQRVPDNLILLSRRSPLEEGTTSADEIRYLYQEFLAAQRQCGRGGEVVQFQSFASKICLQRSRLREQYDTSRIEMRVRVSEGRPRIVMRPQLS